MIQPKASTLGEKLARQGKQKPKGIFFAVLVVLIVFVSSWIAFKLTIIDENLFSIGVLLALFSGPIAYKSRSFLLEFSPNILFRYDHQHFMKNLNLPEKTAIIDGSNIYHFGLEAGFGVSVLSNIVLALRGEGYRIVCFFDEYLLYPSGQRCL
ncbi:MAG: hypothetical protein L3J33_08080 [Rhodobacteraceae bacterium]|nr:hypothetical protein [Paracoccaceae bacterium]